MEFVNGTTEISDDFLSSALHQMAVFLARLHSLDTSAFRGLSIPTREDPLHGILDCIDSGTCSRRLSHFVASHTVHPTPPSLLHGDFWPGNIMWAHDQLAAVIDWEDAAFGPPASDVACCRAELNAMFDSFAAKRFTELYLDACSAEIHDLFLWDIYVGSTALAAMHTWGLEPQVEARRRAQTQDFVDHATESLLLA